MSNYVVAKPDELYHHGVLGMKWGVRRYQSYADNPKLSDRKKKKYAKKAAKIDAALDRVKSAYESAEKRSAELREKQKTTPSNLSKVPNEKIEKMIVNELGNNWKNEPDFDGYKPNASGARKYLEEHGSVETNLTKNDYSTGIHNSERTMKMAETIIKKYSEKRIEDISKKDLKMVDQLIKNSGDYNLEEAAYFLEYGKRKSDFQTNSSRKRNKQDFISKYGDKKYS